MIKTVAEYVNHLDQLFAGQLTGDKSGTVLYIEDNLYVVKSVTSNFIFGIKFIPSTGLKDEEGKYLEPYLKEAKEKISFVLKCELSQIVDVRVVLLDVAEEMNRSFQMADTIVRIFNLQEHPFDISTLSKNTIFVDWSLLELTRFLEEYSPLGIPPRVEVGLTLKVKVSNDEFLVLGAIGGYVDFTEKDHCLIDGKSVLRYQPVFNITTLLSIIPSIEVATILLAAFAPSVYQTNFWLKQWQYLGKGFPQPGLLEKDLDNPDQVIILEDREELLDFAKAYFSPPAIVYHLQEGRDIFPGMYEFLAGTVDKSTYLDRLYAMTPSAEKTPFNEEVGRTFNYRLDGLYVESPEKLKDSRNVDYLYIAATKGITAINPAMRATLLSSGASAKDLFYVQHHFEDSMSLLWANRLVMINPSFIKWLVEIVGSTGIVIVDPNSRPEDTIWSTSDPRRHRAEELPPLEPETLSTKTQFFDHIRELKKLGEEEGFTVEVKIIPK